MILNEQLDFSNLDPSVQRAFTGGGVTKLLFAAGKKLYKFSEHPLLHSGRISPWWSSVQPIDARDTGLAELLKRSERLGDAPSYFARTRNAVTEEWNAMDQLLKIALHIPVYVFVGGTSHQRIDGNAASEKVVFIGGATQLYLPNLTAQHVRQISREPTVYG